MNSWPSACSLLGHLQSAGIWHFPADRRPPISVDHSPVKQALQTVPEVKPVRFSSPPVLILGEAIEKGPDANRLGGWDGRHNPALVTIKRRFCTHRSRLRRHLDALGAVWRSQNRADDCHGLNTNGNRLFEEVGSHPCSRAIPELETTSWGLAFQGFNDPDHRCGVLRTVSLQLPPNPLALRLRHLAELDPQELAAGGVTFLDTQTSVAVARQRGQDGLDRAGALIGMVVGKCPEWFQEVQHAIFNACNPIGVLGEGIGQSGEDAALESRVVHDDRPFGTDNGFQLAKEFRARVTTTFGQEAPVVEPTSGPILTMKAELKGHLLVRLHTIEQGNGRGVSFKIEESHRVSQPLQESGQRLPVYVRLTGLSYPALDLLALSEVDVVWNVPDCPDAIVQEPPPLLSAPVKVHDTGFRQKGPALVLHRAGIWGVAMGANLDRRMIGLAEDAEHVVQGSFNLTGQPGDLGRDISLLKELAWINGTTPGEITAYVHQDAAPDVQPGPGVDVRLECQVHQVDILDLGAGFDLDEVPSVISDGIQDVGAGKTAAETEPGLKERKPPVNEFLGPMEDLVKILGALGDLDAIREELLGQFAYFVPLVENGLLRGVGLRDQVLGVVMVPEKFVALETGQELGLGDEQAPRVH